MPNKVWYLIFSVFWLIFKVEANQLMPPSSAQAEKCWDLATLPWNSTTSLEDCWTVKGSAAKSSETALLTHYKQFRHVLPLEYQSGSLWSRFPIPESQSVNTFWSVEAIYNVHWTVRGSFARSDEIALWLGNEESMKIGVSNNRINKAKFSGLGIVIEFSDYRATVTSYFGKVGQLKKLKNCKIKPRFFKTNEILHLQIIRGNSSSIEVDISDSNNEWNCYFFISIKRKDISEWLYAGTTATTRFRTGTEVEMIRQFSLQTEYSKTLENSSNIELYLMFIPVAFLLLLLVLFCCFDVFDATKQKNNRTFSAKSVILKPPSFYPSPSNNERYFEQSQASYLEPDISKPLLNDIAHTLPQNSHLELGSRCKLNHLSVIGTGYFGVVEKAELRQSFKQSSKKVAIKKANNPNDERQRFLLECEFKLLAQLGSHSNIVQLIGVVSKNGPFSIVLEFCDGGNLKEFLHCNRKNFNDNNYIDEVLSRRRLVSFAQQVANGMGFIHSKRCVHRDLAARNILLCNRQTVVKITDFGLAKDIYDYGVYTTSDPKQVPWRWYAPEFLQSGIYVLQSDIWSFGVLMWEMFSLGRLPYAGVVSWNADFSSCLEHGERLEKPEGSDNRLFKVMSSCWQWEAENRPTFEQLNSELKKWLNDFHQSN